MDVLTIRILDGPDRGKAYEKLSPPISIGREDGNTIQLNDDRVSRFHLKIQIEDNRLILTDLQSTNGTKVNGESVQLWTLNYGDLVTVGRTLMLIGSREQIAARLVELRSADMTGGAIMGEDEYAEPDALPFSFEEEIGISGDSEIMNTLHTLLPPDLPENMSIVQLAQLTEVFQFFHLRLRGLFQSVDPDTDTGIIVLQPSEWQNLVDLYDRLATYIHSINNPE